MKKIPYFLIPLLIGLGGCQNNSQSAADVPNGETLAQQKCSSCHNLDMPPKTDENETAPPLYTVTVHLKDWIKSDRPDAKRQKFIGFVADYVLHPSREKSYCDPESLKLYGLMPSQEGRLTPSEARAVAAWAYDHYDQMKMLEIMKERNRIAAMPPWKQVLEIRDCRSCHILGAGKLAPTFAQIAGRYTDDPRGADKIRHAIIHGSKGRWPSYRVPMRAYPDLTPEQLEGISRWILQQSGEKSLKGSGH